MLVAECGAEHIHVASDVRGADVFQELARPRLTRQSELFGLGLYRGSLVLVVVLVLAFVFGRVVLGGAVLVVDRGRVAEEIVQGLVLETFDRRGRSHAPRVEPDDVELVQNLLRRDEVCVAGIVDARRSRASGVHHE